MIKHLAFGLLVMSIFSCAGKSQLPKGVMKPKQMQEVFWDMLMADGLASELVKKDSTLKLPSKNIELYKIVFLVHNITRSDFESSYSFYAKHPELMRVLLDSMNAQRERKKASMDRYKLLPVDSSKT